MDTTGKEYRVAKWTDEHGENHVAGLILSTEPLVLFSLKYGEVTVPKGADLYRAAQPEAVWVGVA
jgi:hypothetical protein